ncbi:hypothetical protein K456DRAFT_1942649 [Colletotrichum gloeosporioides 23]|nr:hypothetical protein K456DRAFT_1942649 [Colletotrichum gloeosporioides 23]
MDQPQPSTPARPPPVGRFYKSRKSRPCDCCRKRKVVCDMPKGPPCHRCATRSLSCTFVQGPGERKRKRASSPVEAADFPVPDFFNLTENDLLAGDIEQLHDPLLLAGNPVASAGIETPSQTSSRGNDSSQVSPESNFEHSRARESQQEALNHSAAEAESLPLQRSLEAIPGAFSFFIGPTGAADVHLLSREQYDGHDIARPRLSGLQYRRLKQDASQKSPVIFGITDQELLADAEPKVESSVIDDAWAELWSIVDPQTAWRLIQLYGRFVGPCFPIVAIQQLPSGPEELSNMSLGLLAALCASALPFIMHDESLYGLLLHPPSSQRLYRLCWLDISQQFHAPSLATLQACLLFQQRLPTNPYLSDTAFSWSLISSAVAVAQTVGLHQDPSFWESVPPWERRLRKRLWWATWTMEKWISLTRGMPSHIHLDDFDVPDLRPDDVDDSISKSTHSRTHLCELVQMTCIMSDIQQTYYTTRGIGRTAHDLPLSLDLARSSRARLKEWRDNLSSGYRTLIGRPQVPAAHDAGTPTQNGEDEMYGIGAIYLGYIITHMTLFRALLRPLDRWPAIALQSPNEAEGLFTAAKAVIKGSILCVKEFVEMLENMTSSQWNGFWHSWSRQNFAIGGSFMVHLLHITSASNAVRFSVGDDGDLGFDDEDKELRAWITRWRSATRASATGAAGAKGLANLGLLRVETMLGRLLASEANAL